MNPHTAHKKWRSLMKGSLSVFLAESLAAVAGILIMIFLTQKLGPENFGQFVIISTMITWIEWTIITVFARTTVKLIGEAEDWQGIAAQIIRVHLWISLAAVFLIWISAEFLAVLLRVPNLANLLRLLALDIPVFCLGRANRNILVGTGQFRARAYSSMSYAIGKLFLVLGFVGFGLSIQGAILAMIGGSILELAVINFFYLKSLWFCRSHFPLKKLFHYSLPLFLSALSMNFYNRLGLLALQVLGGSVVLTGFYGAAQNLTQAGTGIVAISLSPVLISHLGHTLRTGDIHLTKRMARQALRMIILLLPFAGLISGSSGEIVPIIFGYKFLETGPILAVQIFGVIALLMITIATAILTSTEKINWNFKLTWPLLPAAALGYWWIIPRWGAVGAAWVNTICAIAGALASVWAVHRLWKILPPLSTLRNSILLCLMAYFAANVWHVEGPFLFLKLPVITLLILAGFHLLGEWGIKEATLIRSLFWRGEFSDSLSDL